MRLGYFYRARPACTSLKFDRLYKVGSSVFKTLTSLKMGFPKDKQNHFASSASYRFVPFSV
jgi:hypothetical protein